MVHSLFNDFLLFPLKEYLLTIVMILHIAGLFHLIIPPLKSMKILR